MDLEEQLTNLGSKDLKVGLKKIKILIYTEGERAKSDKTDFVLRVGKIAKGIDGGVGETASLLGSLNTEDHLVYQESGSLFKSRRTYGVMDPIGNNMDMLLRVREKLKAKEEELKAKEGYEK